MLRYDYGFTFWFFYYESTVLMFYEYGSIMVIVISWLKNAPPAAVTKI